MQTYFNTICAFSFALSMPFLLPSTTVEANEQIYYEKWQSSIDTRDKQAILDTMIDMGIKYKELTGKKIDYKKCISLTYKKIKQEGYKIPKKEKKNFEIAFYNRLEERFYQKNGNKILVSKAYVDNRTPTHKESDSNYWEALGYVGAGTIAQFVPCLYTNALGAYSIAEGFKLFYKEARHCWNDPTRRDDTPRDKSNGNQSQSQKDREKKENGAYRD